MLKLEKVAAVSERTATTKLEKRQKIHRNRKLNQFRIPDSCRGRRGRRRRRGCCCWLLLSICFLMSIDCDDRTEKIVTRKIVVLNLLKLLFERDMNWYT